MMLALKFILIIKTSSATSHPKVPFKSIEINGRSFYNDTTRVLNPKLNFSYCDSLGNICDTFTNYYLMTYKKYKVVFDAKPLFRDSIYIVLGCKLNLELNSIKKNYFKNFKYRHFMSLDIRYCDGPLNSSTIIYKRKIRFYTLEWPIFQ